MACVERCVLLGSASIRPIGAGRECASKIRRPFLLRSHVRRLDPDERAHDRGLVADCLATRRPWTPCVQSVMARPLFVLVAAGMSIIGKSMRFSWRPGVTHVFPLGGCTDTAVALGGATLAVPQWCRQCVPVSCALNLARSLTGACAIHREHFFFIPCLTKVENTLWHNVVGHSACRRLVVVDFSRT